MATAPTKDRCLPYNEDQMLGAMQRWAEQGRAGQKNRGVRHTCTMRNDSWIMSSEPIGVCPGDDDALELLEVGVALRHQALLDLVQLRRRRRVVVPMSC